MKGGDTVAELNDKQKRFVAEYIIDLNATQAAIRAGYSPQTAYSQGQRLLKNVEVQEYVEKAKQKLIVRSDITIERVLRELASIGLDNEKERTTDRLKALELIGKHLGMYTDRSVIDATVGMSESDRALLAKVSGRLKGE
jgi:phage terminase small subunit